MTMMIEILAYIETPRDAPQPFAVGIVLWDDVVIEAGPIIGYMKKGKWSRERVRDYCITKGWKVSVVHQLERERP